MRSATKDCEAAVLRYVCGRNPPSFGSDRGATGFTLVAEPLAEF